MIDKSAKWFAFGSGVLLGGILGAGCALLFAPRSGQETQTAIKEVVLDAKEQVDNKTIEIKNQAHSAYLNTKRKLNEKLPVLKPKLSSQKIKLEQG